MGQQGLVDWYTDIKGTIFVDTNGNGKRDPGEAGVPKFGMTFKQRDNSLLTPARTWSRPTTTATTRSARATRSPSWCILEAFNTRTRRPVSR